jgi:hypothetical protein
MDYNTSRNKLLIPEYGRNVQKLIELAISLEDKTERTQLAHYIVQIMLNFNSGVHNIESEQKVWDHLFIISDFQLDVEAPYPLPDKNKIAQKPNRVPYSDKNIRHKTYGRNMEAIIQEAIKFEEGEEKDALVRLIAYNLKRAYLSFNRTSVDDDQIKDDLYRMSEGKLSVPDDYVFPSTQEILGKRKPALKSKDNYQRNKKFQPRNQKTSRSSYSQNRRRTN